MRTILFASRTAKEILRDPLNISLGLGFPLIVLLLLSAIQANIPVTLFELEKLTPGIAVFGLSFMTLFSAMLIAKDRSTAFMQRLFTTPLRAGDYILGYMLPMFPISMVQSLICYLAAAALGLRLDIHVISAILGSIPAMLFFIATGLLCGSIFNDKQVGTVCGALFVNLSAWLSGTWFDLNLVGGAFKKAAECLPFMHAVELERAMLSGEYAGILPHIWWVLGYGVLMLLLAVWSFMRKMKS